MKKTFIINSFDEVIGTVAQLLKSSHTANCYDIPTAEKKLTHQDMNVKGLIHDIPTAEKKLTHQDMNVKGLIHDIPAAEKKLTHQDMNVKGLILPLCVCVCVGGG